MKKIIGQPQFLKEMNVEQIEKIIHESGPISKPEIAKVTGLSLPTVNKLVATLESAGTVKSIGLMGTGAGRKANVYVTNGQSGCLVIYYYTHKQFIGSIVNMLGETIYTEVQKFDDSTNQDTVDLIKQGVESLMQKAQNDVKAIGIGIPGSVDLDDTLSAIPSLPDLEGINLKDVLETAFQVPTFVENDVKLTTLGFYHQHLKNKYANMIYIFFGQGLGSGIIINRKLLKGMTHFAGEIGYMAINDKLQGGPFNGLEGALEKDLITKAADSDFKAAADRLGEAVVNMICMLNPEVVVFGGHYLNSDVMEALKAKIDTHIPKKHHPKILQDEAGKSGVEGAINLCIGSISSSFHIVREKGV